MKKHLQNYFLCIIIAASSVTAIAQESYVIKGNRANVRETPSLKGKILGTIPGGEIVSVTNADNPNWWFISYYGNEGYISSKLLIR